MTTDGRIWLTIEAGGFVSRTVLDVEPPDYADVRAVDCLGEATTRDGFRAMALEVEDAATRAAGESLTYAARRRREGKR